MTTAPSPLPQSEQQKPAQTPAQAQSLLPPQTGITVHRYALPAVLLLTCAIFLRTLNYEFVFDDWVFIMVNPWLETWKALPHFFVSHIWEMYGDRVNAFHYRPLFMVWLLLVQKTVGKITPWWHLISILLHMAVTWLVYRLTEVLTGKPWTALLAAVIFGLYPVHVESVAWISVCGDLLTAIYLLSGFLAHLRWQEDRTRKWARVASIAWFVAAILTKETALTFPAVVLVECWWRDTEGRKPMDLRARVRDGMGVIWPYAAGCAAYLIVRAAIFSSRRGFVARAVEYDRIPQIPVVYLSYLKLLFLAWRPSFFYNVERFSHWHWADILWVPAVLALLIWLVWKARSSQTLRIAMVWWMVMNLVPVIAGIKLKNVYWLHDRHLYLASIGFTIVVAVVIAERLQHCKAAAWMRPALLLLLAAVFSTMITLNLGRFRDELTLYTDSFQHAPGNNKARVLYAAALAGNDREAEAEQISLETVRLDPSVFEAYDLLGYLTAKRGEKQQALEYYRQAREKAPVMLRPDIDKEINALQTSK